MNKIIPNNHENDKTECASIKGNSYENKLTSCILEINGILRKCLSVPNYTFLESIL